MHRLNRLALSTAAAVVLGLSSFAFADGVTFTTRTAKSGNWSDAATWENGKAPKVGDIVQVRTGHKVIYDVNSDVALRMVHVAGTLSFSREKSTRLDVGLLKVQAGEVCGEDGFVSGMAMLSARHGVGAHGLVQLRAMLGPDALNGPRGYPLHLAAGESADGVTLLVDRQHPHDFFMELSASYSHDLGGVEADDPENPQGHRYYFAPTQSVEVLPVPAGPIVRPLARGAVLPWATVRSSSSGHSR